MRDSLERVDEFFTVEGLKDNWDYLAVAAIFILAVWLRYSPEQGMQYLQALDPYVIFKMSQHIALDGTLPSVDFLRYFPYPQPTYLMNQGDLLIPAVMYWLGPFLFFPSYLEWAQFYPALMGGIGVVFAYFFGKEVWGREAGVFSAFFLATIAGVMHRTSAGFFEKEPTTALMMISLYFFTRAWKRSEWLSGIVSGLALGFFTISWGGSKMLWLLYPLTVGTVALLDEDIEDMVKAYTPTIVVASGVAASLNPSRFWFGQSLFIANIALLGLLWSRHLVEEFDLVDREYLPFYVGSVSLLGLVVVALSPLLEQTEFLYRQASSVWSKVTQSSGAVIAGTVAENTPAGLGQIVSQLGALSAARLNGILGLFSNLIGTWPLSFIAVGLMGASILLMVARKYGVVDRDIESNTYYFVFSGAMLAWIIVFAFFFQASVLFAVGPPAAVAVAGLIGTTMTSGDRKRIEFKWYYLLPFFWTVTNVLGAVAKSRLVFLAAFPVAVSAGYTFSVGLKGLRSLELEDIEEGDRIRKGAVAVVLLLALLVNGASGFVAVSSIGGSPNNAWDQSLDYMREEAEPGSVILSWWDYGYWFQGIGRRPSVADGGNAGWYTDRKYGKVNYPIADYFTSTDPYNHTDLFERHSVDYLILDRSMIGKYAAVSQIAHRDNTQFNAMRDLGTSRDIRNSVSRDGNTTVVTFRSNRLNLKAYAPIARQQDSVEISGPVTLRSGGSTAQISCILTDTGRKDFNVSRPSQFCAAENPHLSLERAFATGSRAKLVLVPREISETNLVRLYLMNGHGIDYVEKVPEASNGYIRTWKVEEQ